jgi:hypothetical protein
VSYEYKDEILDDIGPEPNSIAQKDSDNYYNKINELDEVYAKAEAFDEIEQVIDENTGLGEGDEDLVNYETILDEIDIITNDVEREVD